MSTFVSIKSVCGAISTSIDVFDLELNQDGVICCGNCKTILESRKSWYKEYGLTFN